MIVSWLRVGMGMLVLVMLAACATAGVTPAPQLEFRAASEIGADQQLHVTLEIYNAGAQAFAGDERFNAVMQLVDSAGTVRAEVDVVQFGSLAAGASAWPATWQGHLDPGRYTLRWGAPEYGGASETELVITQREGELLMDSQETPASTPETQPIGESAPDAPAAGTPTPGAPDAATPSVSPTAQDAASGDTANGDATATPLIAMARQDLSERLSIAAEAIVLVAVEPETFSDSSLGMPQPGQSYLQVITPGYVIYLQAEGLTYRYNAGAGHVVPADGEG